MTNNKNKLLRKGILLDLIGISTMFIPFAGMFIDLLWAPFAASQMNKMYEGKQGKIASAIVFIEEIMPGLDFIPTFTLMWLYTFVWKKQPKMQPIRVKD
jgi:hypothetical protein